jgi:hypothetical protein
MLSSHCNSLIVRILHILNFILAFILCARIVLVSTTYIIKFIWLNLIIISHQSLLFFLGKHLLWDSSLSVSRPFGWRMLLAISDALNLLAVWKPIARNRPFICVFYANILISSRPTSFNHPRSMTAPSRLIRYIKQMLWFTMWIGNIIWVASIGFEIRLCLFTEHHLLPIFGE